MCALKEVNKELKALILYILDVGTHNTCDIFYFIKKN